MNEAVFEKFNEMFDVSGLQQDIADAASGTVEKKDVPYGDYEVRIAKLELGECTFEGEYHGMPEAKVWFKIIGNGEYAGQMLFMNKRLVSLKNPSASGFIMHKFNEFLNSLETGISVSFENWTQYGHLIEQIFNAIDGRAEYQLAYFENKGYKDYAIVKRFQ